MPHLSFRGLSENWLLKECGHRHWLLLASQLGLPDTDFRDAQGNRLYAAFTAIRMSDAQLALPRENDALKLVSSLGRISGTQYLSSHSAICEGRSVACLTMISVFLRRIVEGNNRQVERSTAVAAVLPPVAVGMRGVELAGMAHRMRTGRWDEYFGFQRQSAAALKSFIFRPCPLNDFNGAEFLYFASFQSIADRAEWDWFPDESARAQTRRRECFYYGNINVGESVKIVLGATEIRQMPSLGTQKRLWCRVFREEDDKLIADVFTTRQSVA